MGIDMTQVGLTGFIDPYMDICSISGCYCTYFNDGF